MLSFLLDEQISPEIAKQIAKKSPGIRIFSLHTWQNGYYLGFPDEIILQAAAVDNMTLVTYDQKTIPPLLVECGNSSFVVSRFEHSLRNLRTSQRRYPTKVGSFYRECRYLFVFATVCPSKYSFS